MANYTVAVSANGLVPAVIYAGTEGSAGCTITFQFSSDWDGLTKEVIFFDNRGNTIISPLVGVSTIPIPDELTMYGGAHKFTVRGFTLDSDLYIDDQLQVTGTLVTTYTAGHNPRLEGRLIPSTLDLFLYQAEQYINQTLANAKESGLFDGADGNPAGFGAPTATATALPSGSSPTVTVTASGSDEHKVFSFAFGIPGADTGDVPDGLTQQNGMVYLTVGGVVTGEGASVVGKNFTILGHYASLQALQAAVPNPAVGDAYSVGDSTPYNVYVFDGVTSTWANYGAIGSGSITVDSAMSDDSENPVQNKIVKAYVDAVEAEIPTALKNPNALTIFGTAYDGSSAVTITMDSAMSDSSANAVQNQVIKAYIDGLIGDVDTAIASIEAIVGGGT